MLPGHVPAQVLKCTVAARTHALAHAVLDARLGGSLALFLALPFFLGDALVSGLLLRPFLALLFGLKLFLQSGVFVVVGVAIANLTIRAVPTTAIPFSLVSILLSERSPIPIPSRCPRTCPNQFAQLVFDLG
jgi:hypothetical protein